MDCRLFGADVAFHEREITFCLSLVCGVILLLETEKISSHAHIPFPLKRFQENVLVGSLMCPVSPPRLNQMCSPIP